MSEKSFLWSARFGLISQSLKWLAKMRYDKEHKDSLSKYPELKERMQRLLAITGGILRRSFRTRADIKLSKG